MSASPLDSVFLRLRARQHDMGVSEYVAMLRALAAGYGTGSRAELVQLCQALWAKDEIARRRVADEIEAALPARLTAQEIVALVAAQAASEVPEGRDDDLVPGVDSPPVEVTTPGETGRVVETEEGTVGVLSLPSGRAEERPVFEVGFDFVGLLPITHRQASRAWRGLRRMQRRGAPTELDVDATVSQLALHGVMERPVLVPRRANQARVMLLVDSGGSMTPFTLLTSRVLDTARQSGLARCEIRFFHDVAGAHVFRDAARVDAEELTHAVAPFAEAAVLIYSDGGAARGSLDLSRVRSTKSMLRRIRLTTPVVAWLNPVPEERWAGTTAGEIRASGDVPMFPCERGGLESAIDVLRGRRT